MKRILFLLLFLLPYKAFCTDSLTVDLQHTFNRDFVTLWINGTEVYKGVLTTDAVIGLAQSISVAQTKNKYSEVTVSSASCTSTFRFKRKWKYLGIRYDKNSCSYTYELSKKAFRYL